MKFEKIYNVRPIQFNSTSNQLFRSGRLMFSTEKDIQLLKKEIKTVVDFRGDAERKEFPNPEGLNTIALDPMADAAALAAGARNVGAFNQDLYTVMKNQYYNFVHSPASQKAYSEFLCLLTDKTNLPLICHCTAGKDRTGFAAAVVLSLLGADRTTIMEDYLKTNEVECDPLLMKEFNEMSEQKKKEVQPLITAREEYLTISLDEIDKLGGVRKYCTDLLHLTEDQLDAIIENLK